MIIILDFLVVAGSFNREINKTAIMPMNVMKTKAAENPKKSAIKPPRTGAIKVLGEVSVLDKPIYAGRFSTDPYSRVIAMDIVQAATLVKPARAKLK